MKKIYLILALITLLNKVNAQFIDVPSKVCLQNTKELQLKAGGGVSYYWEGPNGFKSTEQNPIIKGLNSSYSGFYKLIIDGKYSYSKLISIGGNIETSGNLNYYFSNNQLVVYFNGDYKKIEFEGPNNFVFKGNYPSIPLSTPKVQGVYKAKVTDGFGCITNPTANIKFKDSLCIQNSLLEASLNDLASKRYPNTNYREETYTLDYCDKAKVMLRLDTKFLNSPKITWYKNNEVVSNTSSDLKPENNSYYQAEVVDGSCKYLTVRLKVTANSSPKFNFVSTYNSTKIDSAGFCSKDNYSYLSLRYEGSSILSSKTIFDLFKEGMPYSMGNIYSSIAVQKSGTYSAKVNVDGCVSETKNVIVSPTYVPLVKIFKNNELVVGDKISICKGLNGNDLEFYLTYEEGMFRIFKENRLLKTAYGSTSFIFAESGEYKIESTNRSCVTTRTINIEIGTSQKLAIRKYGYSDNSCKGYDYIYLPDLNSSANTAGIEWVNAETNAVVYRNYSAFFPTINGNYFARLNRGGCAAVSDVISAMVNNTISIEGPENIELCEGQSTILKIKNCAGNESWFRNGVELPRKYACDYEVREAGNYTVKSLSSGCKDFSNTIKVTMKSKPDININESCVGGNLKGLFIKPGDYSKISWNRDGVDISGNQNGAQLETAQYGVYNVKVLSGNCSFESVDLQVGITEDYSALICAADNLVVRPNVLADSYSWTGPSNFNFSGKDLNFPSFSKNNSGKYVFKILDKFGCLMSREFELKVVDKPVFEIPSLIETCNLKNFQSFLKAAPLTDTTEAINSYVVEYPSGFKDFFYETLINAKMEEQGQYNIKATSRNISYLLNGKLANKSCDVERKVEVKLNQSCAEILIPDLNSMSYCIGGPMEIPFHIFGETKPNTVYKFKTSIPNNYYYTNKPNLVEVTATKSPFIIPAELVGNLGFYMDVEVSSTDENMNKSVSSVYFGNSQGNSRTAFVSQQYFCDSVVLTLKPAISYDFENMAIFKDGKFLKKIDKPTYTATELGEYTFQYSFGRKAGEIIHKYGCTYSTEKIAVDFSKQEFEPYIFEKDKQSYCLTGNSKLAISGVSQVPSNTSYKLVWLKNGKEIPEYENKIEITTTGPATYQMIQRHANCEYISNIIEIKSSRPIPNVSMSVNGVYFSTESFEPLQINVCNSQAVRINTYTNWAKSNPSEYEILKNIKFELVKGTTIVDSSFIRQDGSIFEIKQTGKYHLKATFGFCNSINGNFEIEHSDKVVVNSTKEVTTCTDNFYQFYPSTFTKFYYLSSPNYPSQLFKDGKEYKSLDSRNVDSYSSFLLSEPGTYFVKTKLNSDSEASCEYISDTLILKESKNIDLSKTITEHYTCDGEILANIEPNNSVIYHLNDRITTRGWYKDNKLVQSVSNNFGTTFKEAGDYNYKAEIKGGCQFISPTTRIITGKLKADVDFTTNAEISNICSDQKSHVFGKIEGLDHKKPFEMEFFRNGVSLIKSKESSYFPINQSGNYSVKVKQGSCSAVSKEIDYQVPNIPKIEFAPLLDLCNGKSITLKTSINESTQVFWEKNGKLLDKKNSTLVVSEPGNYRVFLRDKHCSESSPLVNIPVTVLPNTMKLVGDSLICPEQKVIFKGEEVNETTYELYLNGSSFIQSSKPSFEVSSKGQYEIKYYKRSCTSISSPINLTHKINLDVTASDTSFCKGGQILLSAIKDESYKYQWYRNLDLLPAENKNVLTLKNPGQYHLLLEGSGCSAFSKKINITEKAPLTAIISGDANINYGDSVKLSFGFTSDPPYKLKLSNGLELTAISNPFDFLTLPLQSTKYTISSISNICGEGTSSGTANIQVLVLSTAKETKVKIYPNPASEGVNISLAEKRFSKEVLVEVYDSKGTKVITKFYSQPSDQEYVNLKGLESGIYILKIIGKSESESFRLFLY